MQEFKNKVVFITGAAGGIGLGMAKAFAAAGALIALIDLDKQKAFESAELLRRTGAVVLPLSFDVTDMAAWPQAKAEVERALGPVSILCNNAGVFRPDGLVEDIDMALWHWMFRVNLDAHIYGVKTFLPDMKARGEPGHIVNTASMAGLFAAPGAVSYTASKFAAIALAHSLRDELRGTKIGISVLCPGYVATRLAETSQQHQPAESKTDMEAFAAALREGMDPDKIGEHVVEAVKANEFYILTHPEYRPVLEAIVNEQLGAFGPSADPGHHEDVSALSS
jgi:NAD(P)-dependent dehydrogenase (short-subunit alcohol dehydrogenase family)